MLRIKVSEKKVTDPRKRFLLVALGRDLSERALILLEKTLYMKAKRKQKKRSKRQ